MWKSIKIETPECLTGLDLNIDDILNIARKGCSGSKYMPVCNPALANEHMQKSGDKVIEYLKNAGQLECISVEGQSWITIGSLFLEAAVGHWCRKVVDELISDYKIDTNTLCNQDGIIEVISYLDKELVPVDWTNQLKTLYTQKSLDAGKIIDFTQIKIGDTLK